MSCLVGILHALFKSDTRHCPIEKTPKHVSLFLIVVGGGGACLFVSGFAFRNYGYSLSRGFRKRNFWYNDL